MEENYDYDKWSKDFNKMFAGDYIDLENSFMRKLVEFVEHLNRAKDSASRILTDYDEHVNKRISSIAGEMVANSQIPKSKMGLFLKRLMILIVATIAADIVFGSLFFKFSPFKGGTTGSVVMLCVVVVSMLVLTLVYKIIHNRITSDLDDLSDDDIVGEDIVEAVNSEYLNKHKNEIEAATYVYKRSSGLISELHRMIESRGATAVVFDDEESRINLNVKLSMDHEYYSMNFKPGESELVAVGPWRASEYVEFFESTDEALSVDGMPDLLKLVRELEQQQELNREIQLSYL